MDAKWKEGKYHGIVSFEKKGSSFLSEVKEGTFHGKCIYYVGDERYEREFD